MDNQSNKPKRIIQIIVTLVGLIIISLLIIGGALLSSKRWDPKWNPFRANIGAENSIIEEI